ncbi:gliding motility protein [Streptomyces orinoci]|uniref:Gliding motility protein n=1 Tax=Streptomyces orinoci TaxID=67339 RepID=A0ABV3K2H3_STRON
MTATETAESSGAAETSDVTETAEAEPEAAAGEAVADEDGAAEGGEGVDIPKQQSADEAADSEAGESARK